IQRVVILHAGVPIVSRSASAHLPTVQVLSPNGGEIFRAGPMTISWAGADLDAETLFYLVQYTPNDGHSWTTLAVDWARTSLTVDSETLPGGSSGRIRVMVTDGFNSTWDQSDGFFSIPNHAPIVAIATPTANEMFSADQQIVFR